MSKAAPPAEAPPVVVKPAPLAEPPPVVVKPAPLAEPPPAVVKPAPLAEPPPVVVKPVTTPEVAAPKINFRAGVKSFGASVLMLLGGWWFSKTFTEPAIESLIKDQVKALEPDIAKRTRKEVENVLATGWATREPRPEYYLYVTLDVWRIGVFEAEMANYDFGTPVVGIREVFVSPLYQEEGPWRMNQYPREWEGNFERTMPGVMIEHNFFTSRTPLEKLISTQ
jgi:hypothetical protein